MPKRFSGLYAAVCATALAGALGGAARAESLADAVTLAYQTNPTLQAARAQLRETDEGYVQALSGYRPSASAQAVGSWRWEKIGAAGCTLLAGCADNTPESNNFSATIGVSQPIYTGGRATSQVREAEASVLAQREQLRQTEGQVLLQTIAAYVDVRRDEQALEIRRNNVAVLRRQVEESRASFDVGQLTRTDVAQSEAQLAQAQSLLSSAQAQLSVSRANYAAIIGQSPTTLEPEPAFKTFPATIDQAFETTDQNNPSIRAADYSEQGADAAVEAARAGRMPQVSLSGQYGYDQPLHPWDSNLYTRSVSAGVTVTQPLFSGGATASQVRAAIERRNVYRIQLEQSRRTATQNLSNAWNQLLAARASIGADEEQVRAATVAFEGTRAEQQVGLRTTLEVLNAQQVLRDADLQLINARHDEYVASASVLNIMGLLMARNLVPGVDEDPGGHSFQTLSHAPGYVPGLQEATQALDSIGSKQIHRAAPPVDAPITTSPAAEAPAQAAPSAQP